MRSASRSRRSSLSVPTCGSCCDRGAPRPRTTDACATVERAADADNRAMFTGIVSAVGRIVEVRPLGTGAAFGNALTIEAPARWLDTAAIGDSIALGGAC